MQPNFALLGLMTVFLTGCASQQVGRIGTDVLAAGAGGMIADKISGGNPYWTLGGGVVALGAAEWAHSASDAGAQKQLALAYERGKAQNAEATYDAIQNVQKTGRHPEATSADYRDIPIVAPARTINGVKIEPSTEYIRISTP